MPDVPTGSATSWSWQTGGGGGGQNSIWGYRRTGDNFYGGHPGIAALTTMTVVANRLYTVPLYVPAAITVDRINIHVTTFAGTNARLGIYNNGTNMYPGTLLLDAGTVLTTGLGMKSIVISQALAAGFYWLVAVFDGTPTVGCIYYPIPLLGTAPTNFANGGFHYHSWYVAFTYDVLPATFPGAGTILGGGPNMPAIMVRIAT